MKKEPEGNPPALTEKEIADAKKEGLKAAVADAYHNVNLLQNEQDAGETKPDMRPGIVDVNKLEPLLRLSPDNFKLALSEKDADLKKAGYAKPFSEEDAKGLLALERAGQNRTDYVKVLMDRLKIDSPYDVTDAGPPYTNDQTSVTKL